MQECKGIIKYYDVGSFICLEPLAAGYANISFKLLTGKGQFLYRIMKQQSRIQNEFEMALLQKLKSQGFPTAYPIQRKDGGFFNESALGDIILYEFLKGKAPKVSLNACKEMGKAIATINCLEGNDFLTKQNAISIENCRILIAEFEGAPFQYPDIFTFFKSEIRFLHKPLSQTVPKGFVHGDAFPENTLFDGQRLIGIIDFEEACTDALLFDLGVTINAFCILDNHLDKDLLHIFIGAYQSVRALTDIEFDLLKYYIHWGACGMIYWHLRNNLLHRENARQIKRVKELMVRIQTFHTMDTDIDAWITSAREKKKEV
ncbi:MAG: homoserine kinase [Desulfobacteraceae bacterium]|nr:homoserine kinase [Desulfobacteraceae bacterium]